jgi:3-methyladenine DNA glycosylase AlkD
MNYRNIKTELKKQGTPERAVSSAWFFKIGIGQYGYGDKFFGVPVPQQRVAAKNFWRISLDDVEKLIYDEYHECRLTGFLILVEKFQKGDEKIKKQIFDFYLKHSKQANNWDLVDLSAPKIIGAYLLNKKSEQKILYKFAKSKNLWQKRISIVATYAFIKNKDFKDTLAISEILLQDKHDLIHKAVGWMLREMGKIDVVVLENFLAKYCKVMPRTMLRYAIEKFSEAKRKKYLLK